MFPIPFTATEYGATIVAEVTTVPLLVWSHIVTVVIGVVFALFLFQQTKKLSSFYLLLTTICFGIWSYMDLVTWGALAHDMMFTWAILDLFSILFTIFTYWFLYVFIKGTDIPFVQKLISLSVLVPVYIYTFLGLNLNIYSNPEIEGLESEFFANFSTTLETVIIIAAVLLVVKTIFTTKDPLLRKKALLGGIGSVLFLSIFSGSFFVTNYLLLTDVVTNIQAYNVGNYSLFGMPFLVGFLGYLVAKYQAFDLKLSKSIGLVLLLMLLVFASIFVR